jgi:hypothetical protein
MQKNKNKTKAPVAQTPAVNQESNHKNESGSDSATVEKITFAITSTDLRPILKLEDYYGPYVKFRKDGFVGIAQNGVSYKVVFHEGATAPTAYETPDGKVSSWQFIKGGTPIGISALVMKKQIVVNSTSNLLANANRITFEGISSKESILPPCGMFQQWSMATKARQGSEIALAANRSKMDSVALFEVLKAMPVLGNDLFSIYLDANKSVSMYDASFISKDYPIAALAFTDAHGEEFMAMLEEPTHCISKNLIESTLNVRLEDGCFLGFALDAGEEEFRQVVLTITKQASKLDEKLDIRELLPKGLESVPEYKTFVDAKIVSLWDMLTAQGDVTKRDWLRTLTDIYMSNACNYTSTGVVEENKPVLEFGVPNIKYYETLLFNLGNITLCDQKVEGIKFSIGKSTFYGQLNYMPFLNEFNLDILSQSSTIYETSDVTKNMDSSFKNYCIYDKYTISGPNVKRAYDAPMTYSFDKDKKRLTFGFEKSNVVLFSFTAQDLAEQLGNGKSLATFLLHRAESTPRVKTELASDNKYKEFYETWANLAEAFVRSELGLKASSFVSSFESPKDEALILTRGRKAGVEVKKPVHVRASYKVGNIRF